MSFYIVLSKKVYAHPFYTEYFFFSKKWGSGTIFCDFFNKNSIILKISGPVYSKKWGVDTIFCDFFNRIYKFFFFFINKEFFIYFFLPIQSSLIDVLSNNEHFFAFSSNGKFWGLVPSKDSLLPNYGSAWSVPEYVDAFLGSYSTKGLGYVQWMVEHQFLVSSFPNAGVFLYISIVLISFSIIYENIFREYFYPIYYFFGIDEEVVDEEYSEASEWDDEADEEDPLEDEDDEIDFPDEEFFESYAEHKQQEFHLNWYKQNHPIMYWHLMVSRLLSSGWNNWDEEDLLYHLETEEVFLEDDLGELEDDESEEWDTEIDWVIILMLFILIDAFAFATARTPFIKIKKRVEWMVTAEKIRVISAGDLFVVNHTMSNFSELFSNFWNNYVVYSWDQSEIFFSAKENYLKLYWDNMLLDQTDHLSYSQIFIEKDAEVVPDNLISFEQWAQNRHAKYNQNFLEYDAVAPPAKFIDINKSQRPTPVVDYSKHKNLLKLAMPTADATRYLYQKNHFVTDEYILYTERLQKKLSLVNEDLINKYKWNRRSFWKWLRYRPFSSVDELNTLIEDGHPRHRLRRTGLKRRHRRAFRRWFSHSRIFLGDYLMFLRAYRIRNDRRWGGMPVWRKYLVSMHTARHPRIFPFGQTYSFFAPDTPLFIHTKLENQYNLEYWNYIRYRLEFSFKFFPRRRRFGRPSRRPIALKEAGHLIRDYLNFQPQKLTDYQFSAHVFKPSTYLKLDGHKLKKPWLSKVYYNDLTGYGRHDGWFVLDDNFWYKWLEWFGFANTGISPTPIMGLYGPRQMAFTDQGNLIHRVGEYSELARTRFWDWHRLYFYEGRHSRIMVNDHYGVWGHKYPGIKFKKSINHLKKALRRYIFLQAYVDLLQSKYGSLVGLFMFHSPGTSLNVLSKTLFDFTIDYSWYEKTHYVQFPDQSFSHKDVIALQKELYGVVESPYSLIGQEYDNPLSSFAPPLSIEDPCVTTIELDIFDAVEKDIIKTKEYVGIDYDYSIGWHGFPFMSSKKWPIADKASFLKLKTIEYAKILNNYRPYSSKNSLVLNFLIDPVGLLLAERRLYKSWLSLNPSFLPPNSNFFSVFKYFKNFLNVPDFSYLDKKWNIFFFLQLGQQERLHFFAQEESLEPKEDFGTSFSFPQFSDYYVTSAVSLIPNLYFYNVKIQESLTKEPFDITTFMFEDFTGALNVSLVNKYSISFQIYWNSWKLLFTKSSLVFKEILKKNDAATTYLNQKRSVYRDLELKPIIEVNYVDDIPPFEDFLQDISYSWWDRWSYYNWPKKKIDFSWFEYFEILPPMFEDFFQVPNVEFVYKSWCNAQKQLFDEFFEPQLPLLWKKAIKPAVNSFKKEINYSAGGSPMWRPFSVDAESWFSLFFTDFYEPYMGEVVVTKKYFTKGWLKCVNLDPFYEDNRFSFAEVWKALFGRNDELHWILMPYISYFPIQAKGEYNEFFPYDASEFNHILHMEPYVLFHDLEISEFEEEMHTKIRFDYEVNRGSDNIEIPYPDVRGVPYRDDEDDDSQIDEEDIVEYTEDRLLNRIMWSFLSIHYQLFLNNSVRLKDVDWLTRFALFLSNSVHSDENGSFHLEKRTTKKYFNMETLDGIPLKPRSRINQVCWNQEGLDDAVDTSYMYPLGKNGVLMPRRSWVPVTLGTYKKGLAGLNPEDLSNFDREDDTGEWWYDDLDIWDFWKSELRNGNAIPQLSVDGDLGSYERSVYQDDFVFYYRLFPDRRVSFTRDKGFFRFFELIEEEDDMDCFEMSWEEDDDVYIYNPYRKNRLKPYMEICPGISKTFIARVFPTPAWHGYPIPLEENGWVSLSWLWRFSRCNNLSYGLEYWAQTRNKMAVKSGMRKTFRSYFADTFGVFSQNFTGKRKRHHSMNDILFKFTRLGQKSHDLRMAKGLGMDLTWTFIMQFVPESQAPDAMEIDDGVLLEDSWDDEEHPMDLYDEGEEFTNEDYAEGEEPYSTYTSQFNKKRSSLRRNRLYTKYDTAPNDGLWEEYPEPDVNFDINYTATTMAFLKSFDFFKNSYDFKITFPFVWNPHDIKFNKLEVQEYPWAVYNFIGERDLNFNQINPITVPYMYEDNVYSHSPDEHWFTKYARYIKQQIFARNKLTLEYQRRDFFPIMRQHTRRVPRRFACNFFNASEKTVNLAQLSPDYLFMFLNRKYFPSFIRDEPISVDALINRYPQSRFEWQKAVVQPFLLKSPVFSWDWWKEGFSAHGNDNLLFKWPFITKGFKSNVILNKAKTVSGQRVVIPNKDYFGYSTYLRPQEEFSMVREFSLDYVMLWQERQRRYNWQFRHLAINASTYYHRLRQGVLRCKTRFNFLYDRLNENFISKNIFLSLQEQSTKPIENLFLEHTLLTNRINLDLWNRSLLLYPFVSIAYNINFFTDISIGYQIDLRSWFFLIQNVSEFYSFFIMFITWAFFGIIM